MSAEVIGKLLAKAERTDNPHEAEAFTKKAEALMVKLGIDEAMARQAAGADVRPETIIERYVDVYAEAVDSRPWRPNDPADTFVCVGCEAALPVRRFPTTKVPGERGRECRKCRDARTAARQVAHAESNAYNREHVVGWHRIARTLGADTYYVGKFTGVYLVGFESDVGRIEILVRSLKTQAMLAMWSWWRTDGDAQHAWRTDAERAAARRDFVVSFYAVVARRLRDRTRQATDETPGAALALRDKAAEVSDHMEAKDLRTGRSRNYRGSEAGARAGMAADIGGSRVGGGRAAITRGA